MKEGWCDNVYETTVKENLKDCHIFSRCIVILVWSQADSSTFTWRHIASRPALPNGTPFPVLIGFVKSGTGAEAL